VVAVGKRPWRSTRVSGDARTSREYNILEADVVRNLDHMEELLTTVLGARRAHDSGDETFSRGSQRASERRFGNYATDTREPDLQTLVTLARVLAVTTDELLSVAPQKTGTNRDRLLAQIEAALSQISDSDLGMNYNFSSNSYFITIT
jgi:hypothetical protein